MDVEIQELPKSRVEIKVKLSGEEFSPYLTIGARELSKDLNIAGFRPGKAPLNLIEKKVGEKRILDEGAKIAINRTFPKIVEDKKLEILGHPTANIQRLSREELEASIEAIILPRVELPPWREVVKAEPQNKIEVKEKETEEALKQLQKSRAKLIRKTGSAQKGDLVQVDYETRNGGVKIENGDVKDQKIVLGEGKLLPGFEDNMVGVKEGEERKISLKAPHNFWKKELRGKNLDLTVKTKSIFKVELPEITDEWAISLGKFQNLNHLKENLVQGIKAEKEEAERKRWESIVLKKISQETKIDLPDILVERERDQMINNLKTKVEEMGVSFEDYLLRLKKSLEELRKDFLSEAEKRVKIILSLYQVAKEEKIEVKEGDIKAETNEILARNPNIAKEFQDKEKEKNFKAYLKENILQKKVLNFLLSEGRKK